MLRFSLNGKSVESEGERFAGCLLLGRSGRGPGSAGADGLPYLFCGNGACRDCNALVEGLPDLPSCRLPVCPGLSLRTREADGSENALSLAVAETVSETPLSCDVVVIGAGPAGLAAARAAGERGAEVTVLEARAVQTESVLGATPAVAIDGNLYCYVEGVRHPVAARAVVIATGAFERVPTFPGSTLPGVLPADLVERYLDLGFLPGSRFLVWVSGESGVRLAARLAEHGAREVRRAPSGMSLVAVGGRSHVEVARLVAVSRENRGRPEGELELEVDTAVVAGQRLPSLGLARALGCRTQYDQELGGDCAELVADGASSVPGIFIAGDAARPASREEAEASGARAGRAAAGWAASEK